MKKLIYLSMVIFTLSLMSFSACEKSDDVVVTPEYSLVGNWTFESITLVNGEVYYDCDDDLKIYTFTTPNVNFYQADTMNFTDFKCPIDGKNSYNHNFTYINKVITIDENTTYEVIYIDNNNLTLKFKNGIVNTIPKDATYKYIR